MVDAARAQAMADRHSYVGVEHLLIALTGDWAGPVSELLARFGVTEVRARDAVRRVVEDGRGDGPRWDDATLLASLGIDLDDVRRTVADRFGADAVERLYATKAGWNLRRTGPLCGPGLSPQFKQTLAQVVGPCWDSTPSHFHERLILSALDVSSGGLAAALDGLEVPVAALRVALDGQVRLAG
ncbi:Clp protease N-terminal domain-containing protein [Frankia sp. AgW1.1]|uniref:Clp protease N-terminal domain-containing protein n=1 Tax=Frankia sp. AgW1.1 TaxID=1836971 RepID=UPI0019329418|nr:Clp protease N-terminal domain-containing protein [Frankia sp. AgW1.1]MBL7493329.1 Clp protease N-terminal domain-containing protein [Frankia sp. AgW1.1]MBL7620459.1 Clp protease N-terminal domain-containing protein [Frankia sp. AgB1.8]